MKFSTVVENLTIIYQDRKLNFLSNESGVKPKSEDRILLLMILVEH